MKKLPVKKITTLLGLSLILCGCANDSPDDLANFEPVANVTYNENVKTIFNNNCIICHGTIPANGAPMSLTTYALVKDAIMNRPLIDRISRPQGAPGMMPNGGIRLPQNQIDLIIQWKDQGLQE
jgi:mono/diheme cytochrome c family protein